MPFVIHIDRGDGEALCGVARFRGGDALGRHAHDSECGTRCVACADEWSAACRAAVLTWEVGGAPISTPRDDLWFALECEEVTRGPRRYLATSRKVLPLRDGESRADALSRAGCLE